MGKRRILATGVLAIVLVCVMILTVLNYNSTKNYILVSVERETDKMLQSFSMEMNRFSMARIAELELMSEYLSFLAGNEDLMVSFLHEQTLKKAYFSGLGFVTPDGEVLAADGSRFPVQQRGTFEKAFAGSTVFSDVFPLHQNPSEKVTAIYMPIKKDGRIIGVLSGVVNMANIFGELVEQSNLPGTIFLMRGNTIFYSTKNKDFYHVIPNADGLLEKITTQSAGNWVVDNKSAHFVKYEHTLNDWIIIVDSGVNPDRKQIKIAFWQSILYVALTLIALIAAYLYILQLEKKEKSRGKRDLLTGLGNRFQLEEDLERKLNHGSHKNFALLFINLDRLKEINERMGYQMGDRILSEVSKNLKRFGGKENLYRVGGDEFGLISNAESAIEQEKIAAEIIQIMEKPIRVIGETPIRLTVSIGIRPSLIGDGVKLIMQDATFAWQVAHKNGGGHQFAFFTEKLAVASGHSRLIANYLDLALEKAEFYLLYQPIYSIDEERFVSFETLMRWKSPELGEVGPIDFIPLLEDNELIIPVGRWLLREVAIQVKKWEDEGHVHLIVTLNISVKQLLHATFLSDVHTILKETGVRPEMLVFEITESVVVQNIELATQLLGILKMLGIQIALDDFGTGYSSLSILKTMPIDYLKVDRAFVMEVESDGGVSQAILKGIIEIARGLNLITIIEGIETVEQLALLEGMGAHRIQGYYFSKPVLPDEAIRFYQNKE